MASSTKKICTACCCSFSMKSSEFETRLNRVINPTILWDITFTPPYDEVVQAAEGLFSFIGVQLTAVDPEDGVFIFSSSATRKRWGYSLTTGQLLWGPTAPEAQLNFYAAAPPNIYQGMLLTPGIGGVLTAYNIKTGEVLWKYTAKQVGFESPFGNYPITISAIADGKIYLTTGEHSPTQPQ